MGAESELQEASSPGDRLVDVGRIGKPHGLKGEVVVHYFGDAPDRFAPGKEVLLVQKGIRRTLTVATTRPMPKKLVVRFEGCERIEDVEPLRGGLLQVQAAELPPLDPDSNYHYELIGLAVMDAAGKVLGKIEDILSTGGNDVYVIRGGGREYLVPAIQDAIASVDIAAGTMRLKDLKGLIES